MRKKKLERWVGSPGVLATGAVMCALLVALGPVASAAADASTTTTSTIQVQRTTLDPFTLKVVPSSSVVSTSTVRETATSAFNRPSSRQVIRIPSRLPYRSAFHPFG
jgi:hypothetical protein